MGCKVTRVRSAYTKGPSNRAAQPSRGKPPAWSGPGDNSPLPPLATRGEGPIAGPGAFRTRYASDGPRAAATGERVSVSVSVSSTSTTSHGNSGHHRRSARLRSPRTPHGRNELFSVTLSSLSSEMLSQRLDVLARRYEESNLDVSCGSESSKRVSKNAKGSESVDVTRNDSLFRHQNVDFLRPTHISVFRRNVEAIKTKKFLSPGIIVDTSQSISRSDERKTAPSSPSSVVEVSEPNKPKEDVNRSFTPEDGAPVTRFCGSTFYQSTSILRPPVNQEDTPVAGIPNEKRKYYVATGAVRLRNSWEGLQPGSQVISVVSSNLPERDKSEQIALNSCIANEADPEPRPPLDMTVPAIHGFSEAIKQRHSTLTNAGH